MNDNKKQHIISGIYFDCAGYGSKQTTLQDSRKKDPTIEMSDDVEDLFGNNVEIKRKQKVMHSFIAPHNHHTYQIDLFLMGYYDFDEEQKFRGGLACIDVLSKYAVVTPIVSKNEPDVVEATKKALEKGARNQR